MRPVLSSHVSMPFGGFGDLFKRRDRYDGPINPPEIPDDQDPIVKDLEAKYQLAKERRDTYSHIGDERNAQRIDRVADQHAARKIDYLIQKEQQS